MLPRRLTSRVALSTHPIRRDYRTAGSGAMPVEAVTAVGVVERRVALPDAALSVKSVRRVMTSQSRTGVANAHIRRILCWDTRVVGFWLAVPSLRTAGGSPGGRLAPANRQYRSRRARPVLYHINYGILLSRLLPDFQHDDVGLREHHATLPATYPSRYIHRGRDPNAHRTVSWPRVHAGLVGSPRLWVC